MKTKELKEKVEEMGYNIILNDYSTSIEKNGHIVISIGELEKNMLSTDWTLDLDQDLFDIAVEYVRTPIEDRKGPKKYYWKLKGDWSETLYFIKFAKGAITLSGYSFYENSRVKLTAEEFEELCEEFNLDKNVFETEEI